MQNIRLICIGKLKENYLREAFAEYEKRLSAYCKVQNTELKDSRMPENASEAEVAAAITEEGKRILAAMPKKGYKIALAVEGKELSFPDFAKQIEKAKDAGGYLP